MKEIKIYTTGGEIIHVNSDNIKIINDFNNGYYTIRLDMPILLPRTNGLKGSHLVSNFKVKLDISDIREIKLSEILK